MLDTECHAQHLNSLGSQPSFWAADVGGTHVRIAVINPANDGRLQVTRYQTYLCSEFSGLTEIVQEFVAHADVAESIKHGVIASAGYLLADGSVLSTNLPWSLNPEQTRSRLGLAELALVNDFEALAFAVGHFDRQQTLLLAGPQQAQSTGPCLVLGPGTGLGAAVWIPNAPQPIVLATEAGQASLAANDDREWAVISLLREQFGHVSIEHALSGPGLMNLYNAVCQLHGVEPQLKAPAAISRAAQQEKEPMAHAALQMFCNFLGSVCGDLALSYGIRGEVYLAGGILQHLRDFIPQSNFAERFLAKGAMREALKRTPVRLVEHGQLGVIGAASWYLNTQQKR